MNFKYLASILFSLFFIAACQQGAEDADDEVDLEEQEVTDEEFTDDGAAMPDRVPPQAATDVSDEELEQFVAVSQDLQGMRMEAQQKMMAAVQEEGLEVERFTQIQQAQQMSNQQSDATEEEMEQYNAAMEELEQIQQNIEAEMIAVIEGGGMTEDRYQSIGMALQGDPELMARYREMAQPQMPQGQMQGQPQTGG